jgi:hypothetical protein
VGSRFSAYFTAESDRGALRPAELWIYGHTHESDDITIGETRVVSNAKGYGPWPPREKTWDNPQFNPALVVEISAPRPVRHSN